MSELIERLRASQRISDDLSDPEDDRPSIYEEAADTIERLEAEKSELVEKAESLVAKFSGPNSGRDQCVSMLREFCENYLAKHKGGE